MTTGSAPGDQRLAALRDELRQLGYLDGRLERFLLRDLVAGRRLLVPAIGMSLRATVLTAAVAAFVLTLGQAHWSRWLGRWTDLAVAGSYSFVVIAPVLFAAALAVSVVALVSSKDPRRLRRRVSAAMTLLGVAYAGPWWSYRSLSSGGPSATDGLILVLLLLAVWLVARVVGTTGLLLAVEFKGHRSSGPAVRRELRLTLAVLALVVVASASGMIAARAHSAVAPALVRHPTGVRLAVVAVDGLGYDDLAGPDHGGWLGALAGAVVVPLRTGPSPGGPPAWWTSLATGREPLRHGVRSLLLKRPEGLAGAFAQGRGMAALRGVARTLSPLPPGLKPLTQQSRRERAFWELAASTGEQPVVVNWWATYPAQITRGSVVSDRAFASLGRHHRLGAEVWPPDYAEALTRFWPQVEGTLEPPLTDGAGPEAVEAGRSDRFHASVAIGRAETTRSSVLAVYFQALDVLWSETPAAAVSIGQPYRPFLGRFLERCREWAGDDGAVVLIGHPGRERTGTLGVLGVVGAPFRPSEVTVEAQDVTPTLLTLLGIPASAEMDGQVASSVLLPDFLLAHPPRRVTFYEPPEVEAVPASDPTDEAARERLRSLGYLN